MHTFHVFAKNPSVYKFKTIGIWLVSFYYFQHLVELEQKTKEKWSYKSRQTSACEIPHSEFSF